MPNWDDCIQCNQQIGHWAREDAKFCCPECKDKWFNTKRKLERKRKRIIQLLEEMQAIRGEPGAVDYWKAMGDIDDATKRIYQGVKWICVNCELPTRTNPKDKQCPECQCNLWQFTPPTLSGRSSLD